MVHQPHAVRRISADGDAQSLTRQIAVEAPVAVEINGLGYAVMMMTPQDLEDFAAGFCLSERLVDTASQIEYSEPFQAERGTILRMGVAKACAERLDERLRHRVSESSCGLCGIDNLEAVMRPLPRLIGTSNPNPSAIFAALEDLSAHQPMNRETGAVHAAACVTSDGIIRLVREDVGRHNAFDKLIGAMARQKLEWEGGFALLTSRCSYELVEKAVLAGCPGLVTVSAATSLAIKRAQEAGLPLAMLARRDAILETQ